MTQRLFRTFFGTASREREYQGFRVALRRATVPPDAVPEHSHATAHLILAIDDDYLTGAVGAQSWNGPSMLVYNPPGTLHRDRFAATGGRFLSIDLPQGFEPRNIVDPVVIERAVVRRRVAALLATLVEDSPSLEAEDHLLNLSVELRMHARPSRFAPPWLGIALESIADLAGEASLRVQDIARVAGVHPVHLARTFLHHLGHSPGQAIRRVRVERAAAALTRGVALRELAQSCGFADQAHMTRCFRCVYGTTPSALRSAFDGE